MRVAVCPVSDWTVQSSNNYGEQGKNCQTENMARNAIDRIPRTTFKSLGKTREWLRISFEGLHYNILKVEVTRVEFVNPEVTEVEVTVGHGEEEVTARRKVCGSFKLEVNVPWSQVTCKRPLTGTHLTLKSLSEDAYLELEEVFVFGMTLRSPFHSNHLNI